MVPAPRIKHGRIIFTAAWNLSAILFVVLALFGSDSPAGNIIVLASLLTMAFLFFLLSLNLGEHSAAWFSVPSLVSSLVLLMVYPAILSSWGLLGASGFLMDFPRNLAGNIEIFGLETFTFASVVSVVPYAIKLETGNANDISSVVAFSLLALFVLMGLPSYSPASPEEVFYPAASFLAGTVAFTVITRRRVSPRISIVSASFYSAVALAPLLYPVIYPGSYGSLSFIQSLSMIIGIVFIFSVLSGMTGSAFLEKIGPVNTGTLLVPVIVFPLILSAFPFLHFVMDTNQLAQLTILQLALRAMERFAVIAVIGIVLFSFSRLGYRNRDLLSPIMWSSLMVFALGWYGSFWADPFAFMVGFVSVVSIVLLSVTASDLIMAGKIGRHNPEPGLGKLKALDFNFLKNGNSSERKNSGSKRNASGISRRVGEYQIAGGRTLDESPFHEIQATRNDRRLLIKVPMLVTGDGSPFYADPNVRKILADSVKRMERLRLPGYQGVSVLTDGRLSAFLADYLEEDPQSLIIVEDVTGLSSLRDILAKMERNASVVRLFTKCVVLISEFSGHGVTVLAISPESVMFRMPQPGGNHWQSGSGDPKDMVPDPVFLDLPFSFMISSGMRNRLISSEYVSPDLLLRDHEPDWRTSIYSLAVSFVVSLMDLPREDYVKEFQRQLFAMNYFAKRATFRNVGELISDFRSLTFPEITGDLLKVTPAFAKILSRCTELDPSSRYGSISDLLSELESAEDENGITG